RVLFHAFAILHVLVQARRQQQLQRGRRKATMESGQIRKDIGYLKYSIEKQLTHYEDLVGNNLDIEPLAIGELIKFQNQLTNIEEGLKVNALKLSNLDFEWKTLIRKNKEEDETYRIYIEKYGDYAETQLKVNDALTEI